MSSIRNILSVLMAGLMLLASVSACSDPTYTVVTFAVADALPIDALRIRVVSGGKTRLERTLARAEWNDGLAISPLHGETSGTFAVSAEPEGEDHEQVAPVTLITGFLSHQTRFARILLRPGCDMEVVRTLSANALSTRRDAAGSASVACDTPTASTAPTTTSVPADSNAGAGGGHEAGTSPPAPVSGRSGAPVTVMTTPPPSSQAVCDAGLERDDAGDCTDLNQCAREPRLCEPYGQCVDTPTGYRCECDRFYRSDGRTCVAVDPVATDKPVSGQSNCALELVKGVDNELRGFLLVSGYSFVGIAHDGSFATIERTYALVNNMTCSSKEDHTVPVSRASLGLHWTIYTRDGNCPSTMPSTVSCRFDESRSRILLDTALLTFCAPTSGCCMDVSSCEYEYSSEFKVFAAEGSKITRVEFYVDFGAEQSGENRIDGLTDSAVWTLE
jgi:hypothetical protein